MGKSLFLILLFAISTPIFSQHPYFQQQVDYQISVTLVDSTHYLHGEITMVYTNNSPDVLEEIIIHTMPNAYQKGTALYEQLLIQGKVAALLDHPEKRGFCDSLSFTQDGAAIPHENVAQQPDVQRLKLNKPLLPQASTTLKTPFRVKIPDAKISRLGHIGNDYMITQWYPKPAVYDRNGWHPYPYLTQGEFYSEFGSFDVSITLPENYFVGATGELQNPEEWERIANREAATKDGTFKGEDIPTSNTYKTLRYIQKDIHDFAFFASKTFFIETQDFNVADRTIKAIAMYQKANKGLWKEKGVQYIVNATQFYSQEVGPYPYDYVTAVDGTIAAGGGMEYPMVTVIGSMGSGKMLDKVIAHEVGHNWFYGILGSDERRYPFMDEGLNSHIESMYMQHHYPTEGLLKDVKAFGLNKWQDKDQYFLAYRISGSWNEDQPMDAPSEHFTSLNYGVVVYMKSAVAFQHLRGYLGEAAFQEAMHQYYNSWKFKHPSPADLRQVFEESTNQDLSWFFDDVVSTTKKVDYKVVSAKVKGEKLLVKVKNKGAIAAPLPLSFANDTSVWLAGFTGTKVFEFPASWSNQVIHNASNTSIDLRVENDASQGVRKLRFSFVPMIEHREENRQLLQPVLGGNGGDGFYLGLGLHNRSFFGKKFEYFVAPAYGFNSGSAVGLAGFNYHIFTPKTPWLSRVSIETEVSRFFTNRENNPSLYHRINPNLIFHFRTIDNSTNFKHKAGVRFRAIERITNAGNDATEFRKWYTANEAFYTLSKSNYNRKHNGYIGVEWIRDLRQDGNTISAEGSTSTTKIFGTYEYEKRYWKNKRIHTRIFGGYMIPTEGNSDYNFRLNSWSGAQDYRLDAFYFNRNSNHAQYTQTEGGFLVFTNLQAHNFLTSVRVSVDLPYIPLRLYAEGAMMNSPENGNPVNGYFSSGVIWEVVPDVFSLGLPLVHDAALTQHIDALQPGFFSRIRFEFQIREINPYKLAKKLL